MEGDKVDLSVWAHLLSSCGAAVVVVKNGRNREAATSHFGCGAAKKWATIAILSGKQPETRDSIASGLQGFNLNQAHAT
jgi:hypothetical protein